MSEVHIQLNTNIYPTCLLLNHAHIEVVSDVLKSKLD